MRAALFALTVALAGALVGCKGDTFECSCAGDAVPNCLPYEFSRVTNATVEPSEVEVDDPTATVNIRLSFDRCERAPLPHEVSLRAILETEEVDDAGAPAVAIVDLVTVADDGTGGDATALDGEIDVTVLNPFVGPRLIPNREIIVRFDSRARANCTSGMCIGGTCRGERLEIPYRLGERFVPPSGR